MSFLKTPQQRAAVLIAVLGIAIGIALTPFATGLLGGAVLSVICAPAHRALARRMAPRVAASIVLVVALFLVLLPGGVVVGVIAREGPETVRALQESPLVKQLPQMTVGGVNVGDQLSSAAGTAVGWVAGSAAGFFSGAAHGAISLVIAFFGLFYLLVYPGVVWRSIRPFLPFSDEAANRLAVRFRRVTEATLIGTILTAVVQASLVGGAFWALGLPHPAFWTVITALVSVLPIMGSALVWLPGAVALVLAQRYGAAAILVGVGVLAGTVDNIVRLVVFKKVSDIHPMITLVGAFAGLKYFGLLGVLLGPLAIAYFFEMMRTYRQEYLAPAPGGGLSPDEPLPHDDGVVMVEVPPQPEPG